MRVFIIGAGAQAKNAAEIFRQNNTEVVGVMNLKRGSPLDWPKAYGLKLYDFDESLAVAKEAGADHGIVCGPDPALKMRLTEKLATVSLTPVSAIHPRATVASTASIAPGCIICAGVVIQPFVTVGAGCTMLANVSVEHDTAIDRFVTIAPGVTIAGWVRISEGTTIFTGANIINNITIGAHTIIGAGATVLQDIPDNTVVAGTPAQPIVSQKYSDKTATL